MASTKLDIRHAFVVERELVEKLCSLIVNHVGKVTITVECTDEVEREFASSTELNAYDNLSSRSIRSMRVSGRSKDYETSASLGFGPNGAFFSITAPSDDLVVKMRQEVQDIAREMRPWFSPFATVNMFVIAAGFLILLWLGITVGQALGFIADSGKPSTESGRSDAQGWLVIITYFGMFAVLHELQTRIFPVTTFALGQGKQRHENREKMRLSVVVALVVSVIASLIVLPLQ
jgi:hypothetical protein